MNFCYIIYSSAIDKYYIGETENFEKRLSEHNSGVFKNSYTTQANDWESYILIECNNRSEARKFESFIKKMKSRNFIESLKLDPEKNIEIQRSKIRGS